MPIQNTTDLYGVAKWIVDPTLGAGTHTTIASALTAASSGDTIFIRPGTYTENLNLVAGVNLTAFQADPYTPNVTILGKCTASFAGTCSISGIRLKTNSDFFLVVSGASATIVNVIGCFLDYNNNTGISFTSSSGSATIYFQTCNGNIATTGIALFSSSSSGTLIFNDCRLENTGLSTTATSFSAGTLKFQGCVSKCPLTLTGGNLNACVFSQIDTADINTTALTSTTGGVLTCYNSGFVSGTASAVNVGGSTTVQLFNCAVNSTNTNAITGTGTFQGGPVNFANTGFTNNVTTITDYGFGRKGTYTPVLSFGGGSTGITYSTQSGTYYRLGNMVFVQIKFQLTAKGSSTGSAAFTLPFTAANDTTQPVFGFEGFVSLPASTNWIQGMVSPNTTSLTITATGSNNATNVSDVQFSATSSGVFTGFYWTA